MMPFFQPNRFFARFPVQVALVALAVYALTLAHGVTISSLGLTGKIAGWDYQPLTVQPLFWLLTLPVHLLPAGFIPLAVNLFSAVCAATTLGFLAGTLQLAAWDRPLDNLPGWRARLPLMLAVVGCGLEYNFWQAATQATGEALQILLLAAAIWCGFKYRVTRELVWLRAAAFIWGLGLVENWMMLVTLPLFIASLIWLGKLRVLNGRVLGDLALAGLAGFSIFAVLPTVNGLWPDSSLRLGEAWWGALIGLKNVVFNSYVVFLRGNKLTAMVGLLYFLLPLLPALIGVRDEGTKNVSPLVRYQVLFHRLLRAGLLLACLWLAFDPKIGLRQILHGRIGLTEPLLSFDYLVGLCTGFLAGNLLLALFEEETRRRRRQPATFGFAVPVMLAFLALLLAGLLLRNANAITRPNRQPLAQFGQMALSSLPAGGGLVLGDESLRVMSFFAAAAAQPRGREWLAVNTEWLPVPEYRRWLTRRYPERWLAATNRGNLTAVEMLAQMEGLIQSNRVYYLHPSFGTYFDAFYLETIGSVFEVKKYVSRAVNPPPLTDDSLARTEAFWDSMEPQLAALAHSCAAAKPDSKDYGGFMATHLYWQPVPPFQSQILAGWYAMALDDWGVQLQRAGKLAAAAKRFGQAIELNAMNPAARINLQVNTNLLAGHPLNLSGVNTLASELGDAKQFSRFLLAFGPVDEPAFCQLTGAIFCNAGLFRQALQQFERAGALVPGNPVPQLALAEIYSRCGFDDKARLIIDRLRKELPPTLLRTNYVDVQLALLEARLWFAQKKVDETRNSLQALLLEYPGDTRVETRIVNAYLGFGDFTNALRLLDSQLTRTPDDPEALNLQSSILLQAGRGTEAIAILDHLLTLTNLPSARLNHAYARLATTNLAAAAIEYRELEQAGADPALVNYGLAIIAEHNHDTNLAVHYWQICLTNSPTGSRFWQQADSRRQALQMGAGPKGSR